jgi:DNA-binding response OmpR family regulator
MEGKRIYIADDEINICGILKSFLDQAGFQTDVFQSGTTVLEAHRKNPADLLIIDIMMPGMDGFTLCETLRREGGVPIIIISAMDGEGDKIKGLTLGGDDYLTKPFSPMELVARVKGLFRRIALDTGTPKSTEGFRIGDVQIQPEAFRASVGERIINLTGMEFSLLLYLVENRSRAVSREELLGRVWGFESPVETRATDDMIKRIRKKMLEAGSVLKIQTIWGYGFKFPEE